MASVSSRESRVGAVFFRLRVVIAVLVCLVLLLGMLAWREQREAAIGAVAGELKAVSELQRNAIAGWRTQLILSAEDLTSRPLLTQLLADFFRNGDARLRPKLVDVLRNSAKYQAWHNVTIANADGGVVLRLKPDEGRLAKETQLALKQSVAERSVQIGEVYRDDLSNERFVDVVAPVFQAGDQVVCVLILHVGLAMHLDPLVHVWPLPSQTAETLLVGKDADSVYYLTSRRFQSSLDHDLRIALTQRQGNRIYPRGTRPRSAARYSGSRSAVFRRERRLRLGYWVS